MGLLRGSVLCLFSYVLYIWDIPVQGDAVAATFADDTQILAVGETMRKVTGKLQRATDNNMK